MIFWQENGFRWIFTARQKYSQIPQKMTPNSPLFHSRPALQGVFFSKHRFPCKTTICRDVFGLKQSPKKFWEQKNAYFSQNSKNKTVFLKTRLKIGDISGISHFYCNPLVLQDPQKSTGDEKIEILKNVFFSNRLKFFF